MDMMIYLLVALFGYLLGSIKVIREYERFVVFTLGRADGIRGPGMQLIFPIFQQAKKN